MPINTVAIYDTLRNLPIKEAKFAVKPREFSSPSELHT